MLEKSEFFVEGRKNPLVEIRKKKLQELKGYMRVRDTKDVDSMSVEEVANRLMMLNEESEEEMKERLKIMEKTWHFMTWHDLSTVANHSHLVFMVNCFYDQATFYTNSVYEVMTGRKIDVQSLVKAPSLHLLARSSSCDEGQLC